ncbi:family 2A encapsulin nanocompartment cargo protein cysteine desulfurase [Sphingobacterium sp. LRF_L2]|uniref:family 2A encapsulin nanocompartment cargo protein cysteine desulfurase n=1 Tax=Sphingobacterium sp. LRF_L2 TaxID=3369421 RepID=UPI003F5F47E8
MSNPTIAFEKILEEIANKQFQAIPFQADSIAEPVAEVESHDQNLFDITKHSRVSPTFTQNGVDSAVAVDGFDLHNPTTSFNDLGYFDGKIPKSVAGEGKQPGLVASSEQQSTNFLLPFEGAYREQLQELKGLAVGSTLPFSGELQMPFQGCESSYYFFEGKSRGDADAFAVKSHENQSHAVERLDVEAVRRDFPILNEYINGRRLVWLDNAATTQKPSVVIDRITHFYQHENSNIHRAAHVLAARATDAYEDAREVIKDFLNADSVNEIVFTRGTTEAINLVASSWGEQHLTKDDEIIISHLEHHANIVPWQLLSQRKGFKIHVIPVDDQGNLLLEGYVKLLNNRTKLVAFTHVSNALGTITPVKAIIELAHQVGAKVLLDGAQSVSHIKIDLQYLNPDFFVFSGHKIFGPTGIGVLFGKEELLNSMNPYQGGGNMINDVTFEKTVFNKAPNKFEAGTGNIADAVGLGAAIKYVQHIGIEKIYQYEHDLLIYATKLFEEIPGVKLIGTAQDKTSVLSFTLQGYTNADVGKALNEIGIAVRTGHHCAQPILRRLGYESSVRPSLAFYNTYEEIDLLARTIDQLARNNRRYF